MYWSGRPIEQQPFHGAAVKLLRRQIHLGFLRPNERLPPERKLAQDIGLSRVTLREALKVLEQAGYLVTRRGATGGTFVASDDKINDIARHLISVDHAKIWRSVEYLRANLEAAARYASERRSPTDLAELDRALGMLRGAGDSGALRGAQSLILLAIGAASANTFLRDAVDQAVEGLFYPVTKQYMTHSHRKLCDVCMAIVAAIRDREEQLAPSLTAAFLDGISVAIQQSMTSSISREPVMERRASSIVAA